MNSEVLNQLGDASVIGVQDNIVTIELNQESSSAIMRNEVVYICPRAESKRILDSESSSHPVNKLQEKLKAEVLRVKGRSADVQVYEDTRSVAIGDPVLLTGELLSVDLGPGLLGQIYDGLQNPLERLAIEGGRFLHRGVEVPALDQANSWGFNAVARVGQQLSAGDVLGTVQEGRFTHKIMVPQTAVGKVEVLWIQEGSFPVDTVVAKVKDQTGEEIPLTMIQRWPVRVPFAQNLLANGSVRREYPSEPLITSLRLIDTFFPIAHGGTACIPGPFGAGKTVLQHLISRYSDVDIVIVVACGERAGEVVETITEFPKLPDPKGGTLMDRTVIICNTSSMPVAAREASLYTGVTLGEYYRQMGLKVLLLADSTSRWAQAMRERSGRLEEIPGEEAFPAYLESSIKNLYERAGVIKSSKDEGSLTMIGTVSPAGGNFEEPVTQATLNTVKAFLGLSAERAYKRFYPAIDPLMSWSRYREQLMDWYNNNLGSHWVEQVTELGQLLNDGENVYRMMQVTGEEGVSLADYLTYQKALFVDMVYLQQDAFDSVDVSTPLSRQKACFHLIIEILNADKNFESKADVRASFTRMTQLFRNLNY
ncbi:MAG: V-type ATP synthase subunit A, partial [Pseudomonadales bacterium]|nr:V-type ATP synthase subunit A [Pseudomonadales bacterium]